MLRVDDPDDNRGLGWRQMAAEEIAEFLYFTVLKLPKSAVNDLKHLDTRKSTQAARRISKALAERLAPCAVFKAARAYEWRGVQGPGKGGQSPDDWGPSCE
jgi:hypothetical protein